MIVRRAPTRFSLTVLACSLALLLATVAVVARGDQIGVTPAAVSPDPQATAVSTGASLHIRFAHPMKPETVEQRLTIEPPTAGDLSWSGATLILTPRRPLQPETRYTVTLAPGIEEARGRASREPFSWSFQTRRPLIVALLERDGVHNLWLVDRTIGPARQLTHETVDVREFSAAPDGNRIVYARQEAPDRASLWIVDLTTGATTRLSPDEPASFSAPVWSPRGDLIVYERRQLVANQIANPKLFAVGADGAPGGLVYGRGDEVGFGAQWSHDGSRLAFFDSVRQAVVVFDFTPNPVVIPVQATVAFDWSPDGAKLVIEDIISEDNAVRHVLLLADARTGDTTRLSTDRRADDANPSWSPDGQAIVFSRRPIDGTAGPAQPWLLRLPDMTAEPLTALATDEAEAARLDWSPDGAQLLITRLPVTSGQARPGLWLAALDGQEARQLAEADAAAWLP